MTYLQKTACLGIAVLMVFWTSAVGAKEVVVGFTGPLSGPAAEYGQDCVNGMDMAVRDINAAGGFTVKGEKYTLKLEKLDDRTDPTQAVNNARRFRAQYKAPAIFNPVFNTLASIMKLNEEKGNEFIMMAFSATPKVTQMGNKMVVDVTSPFTYYSRVFSDWAWQQGWRKVAMVMTLGAYGDEWRHAFKSDWEKLGGTISADKPANYYTETDFSSQLAAALATKPDAMMVGGPSATTALVIEQARNMGFKGGFIFIDQAKVDYMANILKGYNLMDNSIGVAAVSGVQLPVSAAFDKRYTATYKRINTWEAIKHYTAVHALTRAMTAAGTVDDARAIKAAFPKALPMLGDKYPAEIHGLTENGRVQQPGVVQVIKGGQLSKPLIYVWWAKTQKEFDQAKKATKYNVPLTWVKNSDVN